MLTLFTGLVSFGFWFRLMYAFYWRKQALYWLSWRKYAFYWRKNAFH